MLNYLRTTYQLTGYGKDWQRKHTNIIQQITFFHPPFSVFFKYVHNTTWMILTLLISVYMSQNIHHREYYQWQDQCKKSARKTEMKAPYCTTVHHPALGALVSLAGSSRMILPEAGKLLVSNISKPPGDQKVARIARKNSSGHMENNMAENWGKRLLARTISVL